MDEKLKRVERFEELRAGMIAVVTPCDCGDSHRGLLIGPVEGAFGLGPSFVMAPSVRCDAGGFTGRDRCISSVAVSYGIVFRVDDGLDAIDKADSSSLKRDTQQAAARVKRDPLRTAGGGGR